MGRCSVAPQVPAHLAGAECEVEKLLQTRAAKTIKIDVLNLRILFTKTS
jgi:hypothetical protein